MLRIFRSFMDGWNHKSYSNTVVDQASEDSFPASDAPSWLKASTGSPSKE